MDPLFLILSGIVAGCLIGIIILWQLESRAEKQLTAQRQAEGETSGRLMVVDPVAELEGMDTRPVPAAALPAPSSRAPAPQPPPVRKATPAPPAPRPPAIQVDQAPTPPPPTPARPARVDSSAGPLEDLPTHKLPAPAVEELPTSKLVVPALEELPTGKLVGVAPTQPTEPPTAPQPDLAGAQPPTASAPEMPAPPPETPGPLPETPDAPLAAPPLSEADRQEIASASLDRARLRRAELARERSYLEHSLAANQSKLEELQRGQAPADSEEALAISGLQGEIARQRQRLQEVSTLEHAYRQAVADRKGQASAQAQPTPQNGKNAPKAFSARRLSRALTAGEPEEAPPAEPPASPPQQRVDQAP